MTPTVPSRAHADLALAVYLEPHAEGRRVLLIGEAQGVLADRFDRLATHLEIIDPAAREPSRGEVPELPFDDGSFDLVVVADLSTLPEPLPAAIRELQRVLDRQGVLAAASTAQPRRRRKGPAPQGALENMLASVFRSVRVLAQEPLAGYAVGPLERQRGEEFAVDSSLVRDRRSEPERLLGIATDGRLALEPRLWVELPAESSAPSEEQERAQSALVEELRRAEDEAREALHRESDLLRKLETERRARLDAEHLAERARTFERKLLAAEADYDDAVARIRFFESAIAEHEAAAKQERERRDGAERELSRARSELAAAVDAARRLEAERDAARAEYEGVAREVVELEQRLSEQGRQLREIEQAKKHEAQVARDLREELRRLEQDKTAAVEHDARVAELEAERDRAVARALEAEVAREAAQMRVDELRADLEEGVKRASQQHEQPLSALRAELESRVREAARATAELSRQRGECQGLRLRLGEAELALSALSAPSERLVKANREIGELRLRLSQTEAALHAMREAPSAGRTQPEGEASERAEELAAQLATAEKRLVELTRELEEADRFTELHAEDGERLASAEAELEHTRGRLNDLEEEVRALDDDLRLARSELSAAREELARLRAAPQPEADDRTLREQLERREAERDAARSALADARAILSQLASSVGADANDPPSIVQAVLAQRDSHTDESDRVREDLRAAVRDRDERIAQLERWLAEARSRAESVLAAQPRDTSSEF